MTITILYKSQHATGNSIELQYLSLVKTLYILREVNDSCFSSLSLSPEVKDHMRREETTFDLIPELWIPLFTTVTKNKQKQKNLSL